ncbi:acyltransferase [Pseudomonas sp. lyk4-R2A-10]|jgi:peptidoglycan/LPS O-acetylase OafA/YrhL|uniref:acyltransferase family protein n=1 Tax=Pseudomonas sp. lyk4-R2A-10 TaxID=3040315 RepID=UPI00255735E4|nr:acyltransferase [Pseudomonas sp. lyk4-R2A-10]
MNHNNNFNLLRLIFALLVVYSHSFALLGMREPEIFGRPLGNVAVHGFFVISGYLITESFLRSPKLFAFFWNRALRILPGLIVALVFTRAIYPVFDSFKSNPIQYVANGPVWTLTWEVVCYASVALIGVMGVLGRNAMPTLFVVLWIVYLANTGNTSNFYGVIAPLMMMFSAGIFLRVANDFTNLKKCAAPVFCLLLFAVHESTAGNILDLINSRIDFLWGPELTGADVVRIAYLAAFPVFIVGISLSMPPLVNLKDDISYGIYVYGWPLAQVMVALSTKTDFRLTPLWLFVCGVLVTLPIAWCSWRFVERPALRLKIRPSLGFPKPSTSNH